MELTSSQQDIFDVEIALLRKQVAIRKRLMQLPSKRRRESDIKRLHVAVDNLRMAAKAFIEGPPGYLSNDTHNWLLEAEAVDAELRKVAAPSRVKLLQRGMARPNEYREWLIGEKIPSACAKVFGKPFANTVGGWSMLFARHVLVTLGEDAVKDETIKTQVGKARGRVRAAKSRT
jgi:hypothetical protein